MSCVKKWAMTDPVTTPAGEPERESARAPLGDAGASGASAGAARRRGLVATLVAIAVGVVCVDLISKQFAISALVEGERIPLIGDLLALNLVFNPGAAFSLAAGSTWIFTLIALGVVVAILRVSRRLGSTAWAVALGLLLGGATGNLLDRLFRPPSFGQGHVIDFIDYGGLFIGNVADVAIVAAAGLIVILTLLGIGADGTRHRTDKGSRA